MRFASWNARDRAGLGSGSTPSLPTSIPFATTHASFGSCEKRIRPTCRNRLESDHLIWRDDLDRVEFAAEVLAGDMVLDVAVRQIGGVAEGFRGNGDPNPARAHVSRTCLLYTSDAADERSSVD